MGDTQTQRSGIHAILELPRLLLILIVASTETLVVVRFLPTLLPGYGFLSLLWRFYLFHWFIQACWDVAIYPELISTVRHIPGPKGWSTADSILFDSPRGLSCLKWIKEIANDGLIRTRSFDGPAFLLVTSPAILADVLVHRAYEFEKPNVVRRFLARILGWGLIAVEGDQHRLQRKALTPAFHVRNIRELYPLMWQKANLFTEMLTREVQRAPVYPTSEKPQALVGELNIVEWSSRLTLDIIGPAAMGRDFRTLQTDDDVVAKNYLEIFQPSRRRLLYFILSISTPPWFAEWWPSSVNASIKRTVSTIRDVCFDVVRDKKREIASNDKPPASFDILSSMLAGKEISDEACVDQMLTFLAAGHETTVNAVAWACYLLCKHPDVQRSLRAELRSSLPDLVTDPNAPVTGAQLESLPILNGVVAEILRLYPTVPVTVRETTRPTRLAGTLIPRKTWLLLCPWATNRDPALWGPDAEEFKPERWIDTAEDGTTRPNNSGGASSNYAMLTFLHGPRSCIGQGFARAELRCAVAALVGRFGMVLRYPGMEVKSTGAVTTKPKDGIELRLRVLEEWAEEIA